VHGKHFTLGKDVVHCSRLCASRSGGPTQKLILARILLETPGVLEPGDADGGKSRDCFAPVACGTNHDVHRHGLLSICGGAPDAILAQSLHAFCVRAR